MDYLKKSTISVEEPTKTQQSDIEEQKQFQNQLPEKGTLQMHPQAQIEFGEFVDEYPS